VERVSWKPCGVQCPRDNTNTIRIRHIISHRQWIGVHITESLISINLHSLRGCSACAVNEKADTNSMMVVVSYLKIAISL
jgi:hypothetical protein